MSKTGKKLLNHTKFWHKSLRINFSRSELHILGLDSEEVTHGGVIHLLVISSRVPIRVILLPWPLIGGHLVIWPLIGQRMLPQYLHHHRVSLDVYRDVDRDEAVTARPQAMDAPAPRGHRLLARLLHLKMCRQDIFV